MEFKSEISYKFIVGLFVFMLVLAVLTGLKTSSTESIYIVNGINILVFIFVYYTFHNIRYTIIDDELLIKCIFLYKKSIKIHSIKSISKTNSLLSSPAASLTKRIELKFDKYKSIIISPINKKVFVKALHEINPDIESKL